jgi:tRNA-splicing endonuclease subunit Sen2
MAKQSEQGGDGLEGVSDVTEPVAATNKAKPTKYAGVSAKEQQRQLEKSGMEVQNLEHMQLQRGEAFFLVFALDVLEIQDDKQGDDAARVLTVQETWQLFLTSSLPLPNPYANAAARDIRPDNPFILSYVVYHHYRSLGWVVRNGVKFCVDWVLYKGSDGTKHMRGGAGPVGGHAE